MSTWAKPGVKCVCVDASPDFYGEQSGLAQGQVYTVKGDGGRDAFGVFGIRLVEIATRFDRYGLGFNVNRFRPIVTRTQEQDLEHFLPLLNTVEEPA